MADERPNVPRASFDRERAARKEAERLLEEKSREVYAANRALQDANDRLESRIAERTRELAVALSAAEAASAAKTNFLATMSHELRTPLTSVLGYADLLREDDLPEADRQSHVEVLRRSAEHLLQLIERVLDIARVDSGDTTPRDQETDLPQLLEDVLSPLKPVAEGKHLALDLHAEQTVPRFVSTDGRWIREIITCLVDNGLRFTASGGVTVSASVQPDGEAGFRLLVDVVDTGVGIRPEHAERIFEAFEQLDDGMDRRWGGPGLGLTFARKFARLLGGDVTVTSAIGAGATFRVNVPVELVEDTPWIRLGQPGPSRRRTARDAAAGHPLEGLVICLAEDQPEIRWLVSQVLQRSGATVHEAANGHELVAITTEHGPDLVVTDLQMPECDGYEGVERLRAGGFDRPVIAFTAHGLAADEHRARDAGCDDYLVKPVDPVRLVDTILRWYGRRHLTAAAPPSETKPGDGIDGATRPTAAAPADEPPIIAPADASAVPPVDGPGDGDPNGGGSAEGDPADG